MAQAVIRSETAEALLSEYESGTFTQWMADNVDHYDHSTWPRNFSWHGNYCHFNTTQQVIIIAIIEM